jgi:hypothetical protein
MQRTKRNSNSTDGESRGSDAAEPIRSDVWFDDGNIARNTQFRVLQVDPLRFLHHLKQNISDYKGVDVGSRAIGFYD